MYEFHTENYVPYERKRRLNWTNIIVACIVVAVIGVVAYVVMPPPNFPVGEVITIENGASLSTIAKEFEDKHVIKSAGVFKTFIIALSSDTSVSGGDYLFERRLNTWEIAQRLAFGKFGIEKVSVTLPEGLTAKEMAEILGTKLPSFNKEEFLFLTKDLEGYLFPDTYYFFGSVKAADVVKTLRDNFNKKVTTALKTDIDTSGKTLDEIITMASIIQAEAYDGYVEKQTISGILWKRLSKNMLLQVDASLAYINGKDSAHMTMKDLGSDNPYNTYVHKGLPPTPVGNPGVDAVKAALHPVQSPYYFYLHDASGKIHYAVTYEEHKKNITTYLR